MSRVIDCFMFFDEFDALSIRLQELDAVVDQFVLVEADTTHAGAAKPLYFSEAQEQFADYLHKIRVVTLSDLPRCRNRWIAEHAQRNGIMEGLIDADPDDIVIITDCDEIPRSSIVDELRRELQEAGDVAAMEMQFFYYALNLRSGQRWTKPRATLRSTLDYVTPQEVRTMYRESAIPRAGWHFSYLAPTSQRLEKIAKKAAAFAHGELDVQQLIDASNLKRAVDSDQLWWVDLGASGSRPLLHRVPIDDSFPIAVRSDPPRWRDYVLPGAGDWNYEMRYRFADGKSRLRPWRWRFAKRVAQLRRVGRNLTERWRTSERSS